MIHILSVITGLSQLFIVYSESCGSVQVANYGIVHNEPCGSVQPIYGMALKGHVFQTLRVPSSLHCLKACNNDIRCQSINHLMGKDICELNNRTKEARPENLIPDSTKLYMKRFKNRVVLGSIPELAAKSCKEIKDSERQAVSGRYWMSALIPGKAVSAHCDMKTEDINECSASPPICDVNANCKNSNGAFVCSCKVGYTGDGMTCGDINECSASPPICDVNANCKNSNGSFVCSCKVGYTGDGMSCVGSCLPVGVSADIKKILDSKITSSSVYLKYYPYEGRLNGQKGWGPSTTYNPSDFIQVDMGAVRSVCAVATQGKKTGSHVESYKLLVSTDGVTWNTYQENNADKVFQANRDLNTIVRHSLAEEVQARFVRFYPVTFNNWPCMRIEIFVR